MIPGVPAHLQLDASYFQRTLAVALAHGWRPRWFVPRRAEAWRHKPPANGVRECAQRRAQIAAGRLRVS